MHCLCFNLEERRCSNLFATVGKDQATVYDDAHMGEYIGVVLNFENKRTQHTRGGVSEQASAVLPGRPDNHRQVMLSDTRGCRSSLHAPG